MRVRAHRERGQAVSDDRERVAAEDDDQVERERRQDVDDRRHDVSGGWGRRRWRRCQWMGREDVDCDSGLLWIGTKQNRTAMHIDRVDGALTDVIPRMTRLFPLQARDGPMRLESCV